MAHLRKQVLETEGKNARTLTAVPASTGTGSLVAKYTVNRLSILGLGNPQLARLRLRPTSGGSEVRRHCEGESGFRTLLRSAAGAAV